MTLIEPNIDVAFLVLRLVLAVVFLAHGPMKLQKSSQLAPAMGLTSAQVMGIGILETLGILSMVTGAYLQLGALCFVVVMLGAIYFKSQKWNKQFSGENGWEFEFALLGAALAVLLGAPNTYTLL